MRHFSEPQLKPLAYLAAIVTFSKLHPWIGIRGLGHSEADCIDFKFGTNIFLLNGSEICKLIEIKETKICSIASKL